MSIIYVGGQTAGRSNPTAATAITFDFTGSGGVDTVPRAGDLVIVCAVTGSAAGNPAMAVTVPSGYTPLGQLNQSAQTADTSMDVSYKRMGATPDTTVTIPGTGNNAFGEAYTIQCFRGVDSVNPMDTAAVSAGTTGTGRPDPAAITPVTKGAWVVICGGGAAGTGADYTAPANYTTNFLTATGADTTDAMVGSGYFTGWTSGAENPAAYTGGTTGATDSWTSYTLALRPEDPFGPSSPELRAVSKKSIVSRLLDALTPNLLTSTLSAAPPPSDIPLPRTGSVFQRLRRSPSIFAHAIPNLLVTTLAVTVAPYFNTAEISAQPRPPRRAPQAEVRPNLLTTTLASAPPADVVSPRSHIFRAPPRRLVRSGDETRNLLTTTLAVAAPAQDPFKPEQSPSPRRRRPSPPPEAIRNTLTVPGYEVLGVGSSPVDSGVIPNRRRDTRLAIRDSETRNLLTGTLFVPAAADPAVGSIAVDSSAARFRFRAKSDLETQRNLALLTAPPPSLDTIIPRQHALPTRLKRRPVLPIQDSTSAIAILTAPVVNPKVRPEITQRLLRRRPIQEPEAPNLLATPGLRANYILRIASFSQTGRRFRVGRPEEPTRSITIATTPVVNPQVQVETPLPVRPKVTWRDPEHQSRIALLTATPPAEDVINVRGKISARPRRVRLPISEEKPSGIAILTAVAPLPKVQVETPLPVRSKKAPQEHVSPNLINTTLTTEPVVEVINVRSRVQAPTRPARLKIVDDIPNLLTSTLVEELLRRLAIIDRPTPRPRSHVDETSRSLAIVTAPVVNPQVKVETALSVRPKKAHQDPLIPNRIALVTVPPVFPKVLVETPLGVRPKRAKIDPEHQSRIALLTATAPLPRAAVELDRHPKRRFDIRETELQQSREAPEVAAEQPIPRFEIALPVRRKLAPVDIEHQSRVSLLTAIAPLPQVQEETPLFPPVRPAKLDLEVQSMLALLSASLPFPQVQVEIALPVIPKRAFQDPERQNLRLLPFPTPPQIQVEIPLPVRPKRAWQDPNIENRIQLQLAAIPEFQVEDPLFPRPPRAIQDPEIQSRISLLTWIPPLPPVVCDTSVPPRRIHAVWIPDQFNVPILELITNAYRPDIELTLNINRSVDWTLEINRTVEESTEINSDFDMGLDLTGE